MVFDEDGKLELPKDYREWMFVGSNTSPHEINNGKAPFNEMRTIYMDRAAFAHWKETGEFKDGALLLKEVMSVHKYEGTTGKGYAAGDVVAVAAMVKDREKFKDNPGQWGFYRFPKIKDDIYFTRKSDEYKDQCWGCHKAAAQDDVVFTQHYPVLTDSKNTGLVSVPLKQE